MNEWMNEIMKMQSYLWEQQQMHATKNGDDNERELLPYRTKVVLVILMQHCNK